MFIKGNQSSKKDHRKPINDRLSIVFSKELSNFLVDGEKSKHSFFIQAPHNSQKITTVTIAVVISFVKL